jgi:hypothetical protein
MTDNSNSNSVTECWNPSRPALVCVAHPLEEGVDDNDNLVVVDIGKNSFHFVKVRRSFESAFLVLNAALSTAQPTSSVTKKTSYLDLIIRSDHPIVTESFSGNASVSQLVDESSYVEDLRKLFPLAPPTKSKSKLD